MPKGRVRKPTECGHPDEKHFGRGKCYRCYVVWLRESGEGRRRNNAYNEANREKVNRRANELNRAAYHAPDGKRKRSIRNSRLKRFGITLADYEAILDIQGGLCAICGKSEVMKRNGRITWLCVDHDHKTGKVRGLLCKHCNVMIGHGRDDPALLRSAIAYLEKSE
jgi:Recombination endonuclease VII